MSRKTKLFSSNLGTGDGDDLTFTDGNGNTSDSIKSLKDLNRFCIETLTGSVRVKCSLDGENYGADQATLSQEPEISGDALVDTEGTLEAVTTAGIRAWFFGDYRGLKFEQVGATAAQIRVLGSGD